jgi:Icc-related predicted phosphoesterase
MRLVIISDTHTNHRQLELPEGDVLIHCGDYCLWLDIFTNRQMTVDFTDWLYDQDFACKIAIGGNHDNAIEKDPSLAGMFQSRGVHWLQDSKVEHEGKVFVGSPWTTPFFGAFNAPEEDIEYKLKYFDKCDVFITHSPPMGIMGTSGSGSHTGSQAILEASQRMKPTVHCFGHCHHHYGIEEIDGIKYVNASLVYKHDVIAKEPVVIDI